MATGNPSSFICKWCRNPVRMWNFGWKHCTGGYSKQKACGKRLTDADVAERPTKKYSG
jgi:hypothetical protein